jgi:exosome complex component RRP4
MPLISLELAGEQHNADERDRDGDDDAMEANALQLVSPGDIITRDVGFMRGHGTYMAGGDASSTSAVLTASVAGVVQRVNKLISVTPLKTKYQCEIGDVIVGRITEVQQRRWKADINARLDAALLLSSVNLMGGELRRRSEQDELAMRKYLVEGDLISAEVQNLYNDGSCTLHTR